MNHKRLAKFILYVLRHPEQEMGPELNSQGLVPLEGLINLVAWKTGCSTKDILAVLEQGDHKLFELCGEMIRARPPQSRSMSFSLAAGR